MRWTNISVEPFLILFMFLPALIYESSMNTDYFVFANHAIGSIILAGPAMILQVILIAIAVKYVSPFPNVIEHHFSFLVCAYGG
jgi:NhaP-type Na+/H+ or K+/H+ antiporter